MKKQTNMAPVSHCPIRVPMPILKLPLLTTDPLTAREMYQCGVRILAFPMASSMAELSPDALSTTGGLNGWLNWEGETLALPGFGKPLAKVKKNSERVGVHYQLPRGGAKKTVDGTNYQTWLESAHAQLALPLSQAPDHYAPVDDIMRAVEVNTAWGKQTPTGWGVVQGGGLKAARELSVAQLTAQKITNFYLGGFEQDIEDEEWQRSLAMTIQLLPQNSTVMVEARTSFRIKVAIEAGIQLIISDLPLILARHNRRLRADLSDEPVEKNDQLGLTASNWAYLNKRHVGLATRLLTQANLTTFVNYFTQKQEEMIN
jgi:queuine tRNA-ribosyltransferase